MGHVFSALVQVKRRTAASYPITGESPKNVRNLGLVFTRLHRSKDVTSLLCHEIFWSCFYSAHSHISEYRFYFPSLEMQSPWIIQLLHVQIQWIMNAVPSAEGLVETYTPFWILFHKVIIGESQICETGTSITSSSFPKLFSTCQIQQECFHWC